MTPGGPRDLGPFELAPEREVGFGPAAMGQTDPPRSGCHGKTLRCDSQ